MSRIVKQLLYGFFHLGIFALLLFVFYFLLLRPAPTCIDNKQNQGEEAIDCGGPCEACAIKKLKPLQALPLQLFDAGDGRTTVLIQMQNLNPNYGARSFRYAMRFADREGTELLTSTRTATIYAGELRGIVIPTLAIDFKKISKSSVVVDNVTWESSATLVRPEVQTRELKTVVGAGDKFASVEGLVQNNSPYALGKVAVNAALLDREGLYVNASRTSIENVPAFSERSFKIAIPITEVGKDALDPDRTRIFIEATR